MLLVLHVTFIHKVAVTLIDKMSKATIAAFKKDLASVRPSKIGEKKTKMVNLCGSSLYDVGRHF